MKTIMGLLPDRKHVAHVQQALLSSGLPAANVALVTRPADVWSRLGGPAKKVVVFRAAGVGALLGFGVGLLYGVPAGIMNCSQIGCPFNSSTALLALITVFWVLGGAFIGAIIGIDRLEQDLYSYVERVRHGHALVIISAPDERAPDITRLLKREDGGLVRSHESSA